MPPSALRRTFSAPATRSSPYPASLSLSSSANRPSAVTARGGGSHRRASGSDTMNRRVLAEIDWWTVTEGQNPDLELDTSVTVPNTPTLSEPSPVVYTPISMAELDNFWFSGVSNREQTSAPASPRPSLEIPTEQMEALSISVQGNSPATSVPSSMDLSPEMPSTPLQALPAEFDQFFAGIPQDLDFSFFKLSDDPLYSGPDVYEAPLHASAEYSDFSLSGYSDIMN